MTIGAEDKSKSLAGTVMGDSGKPIGDVKIRAVRMDAHAPPRVAMTSSDGVYVFRNLPPGNYLITASLDGLPLSRAQLNTPSKGWIKLDFDLRLEAGDTANRWNNDVRTVRWFNVGNPH
ncbi:MAG: carboxypeptidase-like regulatory domain-containing protein [Chthoniobacterales bacterium]